MSFTFGGMKLDAFLNDRKLTDAEFAASIRVSRSMVTKLRAGTAYPSARTAMSIEAATERAVTLTDLLPEPARAEGEPERAA